MDEEALVIRVRPLRSTSILRPRPHAAQASLKSSCGPSIRKPRLSFGSTSCSISARSEEKRAMRGSWLVVLWNLMILRCRSTCGLHQRHDRVLPAHQFDSTIREFPSCARLSSRL